MKLGTDHPIKKMNCPLCGYASDRATAVGEDAKPKPGDAMMCINCGGLLIFTKRGVRRPSKAEVQRFSTDPRVVAVSHGLTHIKNQKRQ